MIFGVIPAANTVGVVIFYRNLTDICHKLIIYSDWINITFIT